MDSEEIGSIIVIRHAESELNKMPRDKRLNKELRVHDELIDCDITEKGISQCEQVQQQVKDENVHTVFVSPLRRALQTAHHIFKGHKDKSKFIVHPIFREIQIWNCNITEKLNESIKEFDYMDFSIFQSNIKPELPLLNQTTLDFVQSQEIKDSDEKQSGELFSDSSTQFMNQDQLYCLNSQFSGKVEDINYLLRRAIEGKNYIQKYIQTVKPQGKVYLVSHKKYLQFFIANKYENAQAVDGVILNNCQIYEKKL